MDYSSDLDRYKSTSDRSQKNLVSFLPGSACFPVEQEKCHLRLSFSFMSEQQLQQGIKTLCMIFNAEISSKKNNIPDF